MTWFTLLGAVVLIVAVVAVLGVRGKGTRPVANTSLMGVARVVLFLMLAAAVYVAIRAHSAG